MAGTMTRSIPTLIAFVSAAVAPQFCRAQAATAPAGSDVSPPVAVRWWGQACVSIEPFWDLRIVVDPYGADERLGYPLPDLTADLVVTTHRHLDHATVGTVKGKPTVLHGLTPAEDWDTINHYFDRPPNRDEAHLHGAQEAVAFSPHAIHITGVRTYHDERSGAQRGKNTLVLIETDGIRILHCGDLGHVLTDEQARGLDRIDLLIIPVGGAYTIDADAALQAVRQIRPRRVLPIHYNTGVGRFPLARVDPFVEKAKQAGMTVRTVKGNTIAVARPSPDAAATGHPEVIVTDYRPLPLPPPLAKALADVAAARRELIDRLGMVSAAQLDHKPSDGTHTIRWNFEHTTGRDLQFFSQIYHALDPAIPVLNWNPAQMPPDHKPLHPEWNTAEMVRHVQRVGAFVDRFSYLLADVPMDQKIEGTRFSVKSLTDLMVRHYRDHTTKALRKFDLPDWPRP